MKRLRVRERGKAPCHTAGGEQSQGQIQGVESRLLHLLAQQAQGLALVSGEWSQSAGSHISAQHWVGYKPRNADGNISRVSAALRIP